MVKLVDRVKMAELVASGAIKATAAARALGVCRSAIYKAIRNADVTKKAIQKGFNPERNRVRLGRFSEMEEELLRWIDNANSLIASVEHAQVMNFKSPRVARATPTSISCIAFHFRKF